MADSAIFDLTAETVLTAAHEFVTQDTSAATRAQAATFALMGGLEIETTYDTAADHSDIAAAAGKLYFVDLSAVTTNNLVLTLPGSANVQTGERIGVWITATNASFELDLKSNTTGDLINGTDHSSTAWSNIWQVNECVIFRCRNGATGDWIAEYDGRARCSVRMYRNADQSVTAATGKVLLDSESWDNGGIGDPTTNNRVDIRRDGIYVIVGRTNIENLVTNEYVVAEISVNGSGVSRGPRTYNAEANSITEYGQVSDTLSLSAGDYVELTFLQGDTTSENMLGRATAQQFEPFLAVIEQ